MKCCKRSCDKPVDGWAKSVSKSAIKGLLVGLTIWGLMWALTGCGKDGPDSDDFYYGTYDSHSVWEGCHWS